MSWWSHPSPLSPGGTVLSVEGGAQWPPAAMDSSSCGIALSLAPSLTLPICFLGSSPKQTSSPQTLVSRATSGNLNLKETLANIYQWGPGRERQGAPPASWQRSSPAPPSERWLTMRKCQLDDAADVSCTPQHTSDTNSELSSNMTGLENDPTQPPTF